jgi:hypothetical protein
MTDFNPATITPPPGLVQGMANDAYVAFVQICKGNSDDAGTYDVDEKIVRQALARLDELERLGTPPQPIPVAERLPGLGIKVIAHYINRCGKARTIIAEWVPAKSRKDEDCGFEGSEYDEETDCYWWPEDWYEQIDNWDDYTAIAVHEGEITHWQPLPKLPALPLPEVAP